MISTQARQAVKRVLVTMTRTKHSLAATAPIWSKPPVVADLPPGSVPRVIPTKVGEKRRKHEEGDPDHTVAAVHMVLDRLKPSVR
jgi:hypothetical protein